MAAKSYTAGLCRAIWVAGRSGVVVAAIDGIDGHLSRRRCARSPCSPLKHHDQQFSMQRKCAFLRRSSRSFQRPEVKGEELPCCRGVVVSRPAQQLGTRPRRMAPEVTEAALTSLALVSRGAAAIGDMGARGRSQVRGPLGVGGVAGGHVATAVVVCPPPSNKKGVTESPTCLPIGT